MEDFFGSIFSSGAAKWTWAALVAIATVVAPIYSVFLAPAIVKLREKKKIRPGKRGKLRKLKPGDIIVTLIPVNNSQKVYQGFGEDANVDIGTGKACDLVLDCDDSISKSHCCISVQNGHFFIKDFNSTNGTYLNGKCIDKVQEFVPDQDTVLRLGETEFFVNVLAYKEEL